MAIITKLPHIKRGILFSTGLIYQVISFKGNVEEERKNPTNKKKPPTLK